MINIFKRQNFQPNQTAISIYDVNYEELKKLGKKTLLFDLDNTIAVPQDRKPTPKIIEFFNEIQKEFTVYLVSNNDEKRVSEYGEALGINYYAAFMKPFSKNFKKHFSNIEKEEIAIIGDQVVTDVLGGNRFGIHTVLVRPINSQTDEWFTKINRLGENLATKIHKVDRP